MKSKKKKTNNSKKLDKALGLFKVGIKTPYKNRDEIYDRKILVDPTKQV